MMLIHEVCKKCNLTKKAIEYYGEQGLISPAVTENGYRQFSDDDVEKLKKIAVMRGLGLSVADIRVVLKDNSQSALLPMLHKKELEIATMKEKQEIMQRLVNSGDWEAVQLQMEALQSRQSILTRILDKFPGGYGRLVCMHFAPFLSEPIQTEDQQQAYETIISFLDDITISIPDDLQEYLSNSLTITDLDSMQKAFSALSAALDDPQGFIASNQEMLKQYQAVMESVEYRASPAYRLKECLNEFQTKIGYQDIFIPAMQRLSLAYRDYYAFLQRANDTFKQYFDR